MKRLVKKIVPQDLINWTLKIITFISIKVFRLKNGNLIIRKKTSDSSVFTSIFILGEFNFSLKFNPKLIIDGGAYSGLSSLYFSLNYPLSKIIAIEPEISNFETLKVNTKNRKNIKRIMAGLWYKDAFLKINNVNNEKWGFQVEEVSEIDDYDIKAITVDSILKNSGFDFIDVLKLDIEGAEKELFSYNSNGWLDKTNVIIIELHDRFKDGCSDALYKSINIDDWYINKNGEKVVLIRKKIFLNE